MVMMWVGEGVEVIASFVWLSSSPSSPDPMVCTGCCSTLDHILSFLFKKLSKLNGAPMSPSHSTPFLRILELHPEILQQMLSSIMNTIIFENCRNQWSMSRPLLGLILLNEEVRNTMCIVSSQ